jgi:hypothetical protein
MKKLYYLIFAIIFIVSCKSEIEKVEVEVPAIRASKLFDADSVYSYMIQNGDKYQHLAHSYLNKAKEEKDPEKAVWYFKRAISLYPQVDSYRELGALCLKNKKYQDAYDCYRLITHEAYLTIKGDYNGVHIFGKPSQEDFENYIISGYNSTTFYQDLSGLIYNSLENGADKKQLEQFVFSNSGIDFLTQPKLKKHIELIFLEEEELQKYTENIENFRTYIADFKNLDEPYLLNFEDIQKFEYQAYQQEEGSEEVDLGYLESNFLPQRKENPNSYLKYNKVAKLVFPDSSILAIYSLDSSDYGIEKQKRNISFYAVIYSAAGQIIDYKKIAWQENKTSATLSYSNSSFEISIFNRIWEKKEEVLSRDNELKNIVFSKKEAFKIEKGKFISKS